MLDELDLEQTSSESEDEGASSLHQQSRLEDQEHNDSQFEDADESGEAATNASMDVKDDVMGTQGEAGHAERASRRGKSRKSNMPKRIKQKVCQHCAINPQGKKVLKTLSTSLASIAYMQID